MGAGTFCVSSFVQRQTKQSNKSHQSMSFILDFKSLSKMPCMTSMNCNYSVCNPISSRLRPVSIM